MSTSDTTHEAGTLIKSDPIQISLTSRMSDDCNPWHCLHDLVFRHLVELRLVSDRPSIASILSA